MILQSRSELKNGSFTKDDSDVIKNFIITHYEPLWMGIVRVKIDRKYDELLTKTLKLILFS